MAHYPATTATRKRGYACAALALTAGFTLAACGGPSYLTVKGRVSSTLPVLQGNAGDCVLALPSRGSQMTISAGGVTVASAKIQGPTHQHKTAYGETCWVGFTFASVPAGKQKYAIKLNVSHGTEPLGVPAGCRGTVYDTPAQLAKPVNLTCS
jgi:hypothetical protein